jgi:hypothetical protein
MESKSTSGYVLAHMPDIRLIIKTKKDKICLLTGVTIPSDNNALQKEAENKLTYKN